MNQPKLSKRELRSAIIGMVLGDSNVRVRYQKGNMQLAHKPASEDYVKFKQGILEQLSGTTCKYRLVQHINRKLNKIYPTIRVWTSSSRFFYKLNKMFYKPKKQVTKNILNGLTPLGLAIWYMDDGHLSLKHNAIRSEADKLKSFKERSICSRTIMLCSHSFSKEENEMIVKWLKDNYNIISVVKTSRGHFYIVMNTANTKLFVDVVREYVLQVPSMHYKIDLRYVKSNPDSLKYNIENYTKEKEQERTAS